MTQHMTKPFTKGPCLPLPQFKLVQLIGIYLSGPLVETTLLPACDELWCVPGLIDLKKLKSAELRVKFSEFAHKLPSLTNLTKYKLGSHLKILKYLNICKAGSKKDHLKIHNNAEAPLSFKKNMYQNFPLINHTWQLPMLNQTLLLLDSKSSSSRDAVGTVLFVSKLNPILPVPRGWRLWSHFGT
ncbi:hypothetical protein VP01_522g4 [Puccinia sorghi]|uniref:Uncharacterized protein n=1 Tax=Puccinia sorghi TaxID=27349 RepID=A0A0L6ULC5_9BASI|nr:hypothetical protein VP01_522g4 [Puccinia sorghi]